MTEPPFISGYCENGACERCVQGPEFNLDGRMLAEECTHGCHDAHPAQRLCADAVGGDRVSEYDPALRPEHGPHGADCGCCDIVDAVTALYRDGRRLEGVTFMGSPFPPAVTLVDLGTALGLTPEPPLEIPLSEIPAQPRKAPPPDLCANLIASFDEGERTKPKRGSW